MYNNTKTINTGERQQPGISCAITLYAPSMNALLKRNQKKSTLVFEQYASLYADTSLEPKTMMRFTLWQAEFIRKMHQAQTRLELSYANLNLTPIDMSSFNNCGYAHQIKVTHPIVHTYLTTLQRIDNVLFRNHIHWIKGDITQCVAENINNQGCNIIKRALNRLTHLVNQSQLTNRGVYSDIALANLLGKTPQEIAGSMKQAK
ncbi:hypothetical protein [Pseudoalteromonas sp. T1lg23B]|uniref:hypothetical protein n=1 Tax=Pseudoalteromonas sp. T1lg23B TaxID=2077097 RepID=UPI000CF61899|nr:hypothetical protein [Pseudoalteromonas sp. T1lg23B]